MVTVGLGLGRRLSALVVACSCGPVVALAIVGFRVGIGDCNNS